MRFNIIIITVFIFTVLGCVEETNPDNAREDFLGNWTCNEYEGDFAPQTYNVEVIATGPSNDVIIRGLYNQGPGFDIFGIVNGSSITIQNQTVDGIQIGGIGNINDNLNRVELSFTANDGSGVDDVKATWLR